MGLPSSLQFWHMEQWKSTYDMLNADCFYRLWSRVRLFSVSAFASVKSLYLLSRCPVFPLSVAFCTLLMHVSCKQKLGVQELRQLPVPSW